MVAVSAQELGTLEKQLKGRPEGGTAEAIRARVSNKLTLCFYPAMTVPLHVTNLTGKSKCKSVVTKLTMDTETGTAEAIEGQSLM